MDEAEKYQQRLQAIAEKRRLQEEQERKRRELEDEKLRLQQLKRKSLRDQWLMEGPSSPDSSGVHSPLWGSQAQEIEEHIDQLQVESQCLAEKEKNLKEPRANEEHQTDGNGVAQGCKKTDMAEEGVKDSTPHQPSMAGPHLRMDMQNGQEERAVLGVMEVQVEKDLKTGATAIKSAAPMDTGAAACLGEKLFDDGIRSVHTVAGIMGVQPSPEELGQILNAVLDVAAPVEARVIINGRKEAAEEVCDAPSEETGSCVEQEALHQLAPLEEMPKVNGIPKDVLPGAEVEEGIVTMTFLGYSETEPGQGLDGEDMVEVIRAERVIIMDDGDDQANLVKEPPPEDIAETSAPTDSFPSTEMPQPGAANPGLGSEAEVQSEPEAKPEPQPGSGTPSDSEVAPESELAEVSTEGIDDADPGAEDGGEQDAGPEATECSAEPSQCTMNSMELGSEVQVEGAEPGDKVEEEPTALAAQREQFQEVPLDGDMKPEIQPLLGATESAARKQEPSQTPEQQPLLSSSSAPPDSPVHSCAEEADTPKHKSCHCCSVM